MIFARATTAVLLTATTVAACLAPTPVGDDGGDHGPLAPCAGSAAVSLDVTDGDVDLVEADVPFEVVAVGRDSFSLRSDAFTLAVVAPGLTDDGFAAPAVGSAVVATFVPYSIDPGDAHLVVEGVDGDLIFEGGRMGGRLQVDETHEPPPCASGFADMRLVPLGIAVDADTSEQIAEGAAADVEIDGAPYRARCLAAHRIECAFKENACGGVFASAYVARVDLDEADAAAASAR